MNRCIYRGATKLFIPLPLVDAFHCYQRDMPHRKCVYSTPTQHREWVEDNGYNICTECNKSVSVIDAQKQQLTTSDEMVFISTDMLMIDTLHLAAHVPHNCKGIVGVARSGLIPAAALATHLHLPLYEFSPNPETKQFQVRQIISGTRGNNMSAGDGPLFVIDDTIHSASMASIIRTFFGNSIIYGVVYALPDAVSKVDVYQRLLPSPHLLEWNLFNTLIISGHGPDPRTKGGFAFDFDGILCYDPPPDSDHNNDDLSWIVNARPTAYMPRSVTIPLIITMRLERWRNETVEWLRKHKITYDRLEMCKYDSAKERDANHVQAVIEHKVKYFYESECSFFIESDPFQASLINQLTGKPVLCPIERKIYQSKLHQ